MDQVVRNFAHTLRRLPMRAPKLIGMGSGPAPTMTIVPSNARVPTMAIMLCAAEIVLIIMSNAQLTAARFFSSAEDTKSSAPIARAVARFDSLREITVTWAPKA